MLPRVMAWLYRLTIWVSKKSKIKAPDLSYKYIACNPFVIIALISFNF